MTWQGALLTFAIAVATAIAAGWFNKPKVKAEGKKLEGDGALAEAQATSERFAEYRRTTDATIGELRGTCESCRRELIANRTATEKLIDAVEALIENNGLTERQAARLAIREYRNL